MKKSLRDLSEDPKNSRKKLSYPDSTEAAWT